MHLDIEGGRRQGVSAAQFPMGNSDDRGDASGNGRCGRSTAPPLRSKELQSASERRPRQGRDDIIELVGMPGVGTTTLTPPPFRRIPAYAHGIDRGLDGFRSHEERLSAASAYQRAVRVAPFASRFAIDNKFGQPGSLVG